MRETLRRLPLEQAVSLGIVGTLLLVACGSNWSPSVRSVAGPLRWVMLAALCGAALSFAYVRSPPRPGRRFPAVYGAVLAFLALGCVSVFWSTDPRLTAGRVVAFSTIVVTAAALAFAAAGRREAVTSVLVAVLAGGVVVALVGLAILAVDPGNAVQEATSSSAARYRGLGQNPNTVVMLLAVGMPIATWLLLREHGRLRLAAGAALLLLAGSIIASGSRAAIVAGFAASAAPALAAARTNALRVAVVVGAVAALAAGIAITKIPKPNSNANRSASVYTNRCTPNDAECSLRQQDEIGRPPGGRYEPPKGRTIFGSSGRVDAWEGAIRQGVDRPGLGYGFGTEGRVFTDRYYYFQGGVPENSFIGMFLQLGLLGVVLLLTVLGCLVYAGGRALLGAERAARPQVAACAAVLLVGLFLALFQSYLYSAGNTATLSVWICSFLLTALAAGRAAAT